MNEQTKPKQIPEFSNNQNRESQNWKAGKNIGFIFRLIVTLLIIAYLAIKVNGSELLGQLNRANPYWLLVACMLFGVVNVLAALRWWFLLQVQEIHLSFRSLTAITFIGQFFNSFLFGAIGGDIIKAVYLQKYAPHQKTHATLSIIMDRVIGMLVLISASLVAMAWQFQHLLGDGKANSVMIALSFILGIGIVGGIVLLCFPFNKMPLGIRVLWNKIPHRHVLKLVISGFRQHGVALELTIASLVVGIVLTAVLVAAGYCIGIGIGLTVSYLQMLVIMTVVICAISLPISIGGHGVREGIFVIMFATFGLIHIDQKTGGGGEIVILFSLLFYLIPLVWSIVGGIVYLAFRHDYDLVTVSK